MIANAVCHQQHSTCIWVDYTPMSLFLLIICNKGKMLDAIYIIFDHLFHMDLLVVTLEQFAEGPELIPSEWQKRN
jgi:hypothetical protein